MYRLHRSGLTRKYNIKRSCSWQRLTPSDTCTDAIIQRRWEKFLSSLSFSLSHSIPERTNRTLITSLYWKVYYNISSPLRSFASFRPTQISRPITFSSWGKKRSLTLEVLKKFHSRGWIYIYISAEIIPPRALFHANCSSMGEMLHYSNLIDYGLHYFNSLTKRTIFLFPLHYIKWIFFQLLAT